jgi:hypothetical protein
MFQSLMAPAAAGAALRGATQRTGRSSADGESGVPERLLTHSAWRGYRRADFPDASWAVESETLHARADGTLSLVTRQSFGDFDLTLHWRLPVAGNSGILYRVSEAFETPWESGLEMQLIDNSGHPDGQTPETSCGALYGLQAPHDVPLCPPGLFNVARVSMRGSRVEHWLNGVLVLSCDVASEDFRARVARSKFGGFPQFARCAQGHIVLQHHGTEAWFYDIRVGTP